MGHLSLMHAEIEEDPADRWLRVYGWIQTGDQLAKAEQWALAYGSYLEADRQINKLIAAHANFEPEMVAYRRENLAKIIKEADERLTTDEHEVMMKYLDFIETMELGVAQRYRKEFQEAYDTLTLALTILEETASQKPEAFRETIAPQYESIDGHLTWLSSQIEYKAKPPPSSGGYYGHSNTKDWGTTRYVKKQDLPTTDKSPPLISSELFPLTQQAKLELTTQAPTQKEANEEVVSSSSSTNLPRFRMSAKRSIPETTQSEPDSPQALPTSVP